MLHWYLKQVVSLKSQQFLFSDHFHHRRIFRRKCVIYMSFNSIFLLINHIKYKKKKSNVWKCRIWTHQIDWLVFHLRVVVQRNEHRKLLGNQIRLLVTIRGGMWLIDAWRTFVVVFTMWLSCTVLYLIN